PTSNRKGMEISHHSAFRISTSRNGYPKYIREPIPYSMPSQCNNIGYLGEMGELETKSPAITTAYHTPPYDTGHLGGRHDEWPSQGIADTRQSAARSIETYK
ncbi:Hypothetical predicted protein, partial [Pelobates cultripes]